MIGQFLLAFREVLEAALITSIVFAYLLRTGRKHLTVPVWVGVSTAVVVSFLLGVFVWFVFGVLSDAVQVLFEGSAAILAVVVLTSMIFWLATKGKEIRKEVESRIETIASRGTEFALGSFSFVIVFREGLETVLFLTPFVVSDPLGSVVGAVFGALAAIAFSYGLFIAGMRIDLRRFFYFTSILLVLVAGGLAGYGVHELMEYAEIVRVGTGWFGAYAYNLNYPEGSLLHHKGLVGSILAVLFGYTVKAEWGRLLVHFGYLLFALPFVVRSYGKE